MEGLNCKNEKSNLKMQRPNMALTKHGIRANGLSFLRDQTVERERGESKRENKRKRKRKRRRREEEAKPKRYGTITIKMNTCFGLYGTTLDKDFFN